MQTDWVAYYRTIDAYHARIAGWCRLELALIDAYTTTGRHPNRAERILELADRAAKNSMLARWDMRQYIFAHKES
jgi:hypothetical protein